MRCILRCMFAPRSPQMSLKASMAVEAAQHAATSSPVGDAEFFPSTDGQRKHPTPLSRVIDAAAQRLERGLGATAVGASEKCNSTESSEEPFARTVSTIMSRDKHLTEGSVQQRSWAGVCGQCGQTPGSRAFDFWCCNLCGNNFCVACCSNQVLNSGTSISADGHCLQRICDICFGTSPEIVFDEPENLRELALQVR